MQQTCYRLVAGGVHRQHTVLAQTRSLHCKAHTQAAGLQTVVDRYLLAKPITDPVDLSMM